jgi:hypothetical protein
MISLLIGLIFMTSQVFAEERSKTEKQATTEKKECSFFFESFQSPIFNDPIKFKQVQFPIRNSELRTIQQAAIMKDGEVLEFYGSGCEHQIYSIVYSNAKIKAGAAWENISVAIQLLERTPMDAGVRRIFISGLKKAKQKKSEGLNLISLICGGGECSLEKDISKIKLTYKKH